LRELGLWVTVRREPGIKRPRDRRVGSFPAECSLSARAVGRRHLLVRCWRPGDRIKPLGMQGSRKLQDIFVDAKLPADDRARIPLFECGGEIVWVPGYRVARGWEVPDERAAALQIRIGRRPSA
jgi:tRNA(Ile)-lysidine synthase